MKGNVIDKQHLQKMMLFMMLLMKMMMMLMKMLMMMMLMMLMMMMQYLPLVYRARGAVVSSTICGVPPNIANTSPPIVWENNTRFTSVIHSESFVISSL